jgi:hypothetical protein
MTRRALWSLCLLAAALPLAAQTPSEAEHLVFQHEHLANIRQPGTLRYLYVEDAPGQPRVSDSAVLRLANGADGRCCDVGGQYLSGAMAVNLPDIPAASSNPVLLYFLEGEVRRLQRTTKGQAAHFRRRMRQSLADSASVTPTTIQWRGQAVPAKIVQVAPFVADPYRERFADQAATQYAIVLSDAVPGGVYQMRAELPGQPPGAAPLAQRTLTLAQTQ